MRAEAARVQRPCGGRLALGPPDRLQIDVRDYVLDVLPKLPDWPISKVAELTPSAWQLARQSS